ncbi:MAG: CpsD/CapB family tyrosine-protein kinase [Ardenticatenaceae bacterium]|nr:CpsD/CapB family tyrosine-protein kinase [Ardenticatenaceae bacterium]HBY94075.1 capsular biosynthesis protein [Chloroflexota bacterium]
MTIQGRAALITLTDPRSPVSEAYRSLRTNLEFASLTGPLRSLVITSPGPGEGKSTMLANLAVTMAQAGKKTIVVDTDLRRPSQHELFGLDQEPGVTTMFMDPALQSAPPLQATEIEGLWLLASGPKPPNPAELLAAPQLRTIIEALTARADIVLFDAPPVVVVTDAAVLASQVDGVLLVIQAGKTKRDQAAQAKTLLDQVRARLVGTALTNVKLDPKLQGYY